MREIRPPGGSGAARSMRSADISDFRGGLNLSDDLFKLGESESADILNLDVHGRGGVSLRGGMREQSATVAGNLLDSNMFRFQQLSGTDGLYAWIVTDDATVTAQVTTTGGQLGTPTFTVADLAREPGVTSAQMDDIIYVTSKRWAPFNGAWDGSQVSWGNSTIADTGTWGTVGAFPHATISAVWDNRMWVANTYEDSTNKRNRVRYSDDGQPRTWQEDNWIDIDVGEDGDRITALAVHGEILVVFKQRSVHAILPDDTTVFRVVGISDSVGAVSADAVVSTPFGLAFWDQTQGLHMWDSGQPVPVGVQLEQAIYDGRITNVGAVSYVNGRIWCAADFESVGSTFVFDPRLTAWTRYTPRVESVFTHDSGALWGWSPTHSRWLQVDVRDQFDDFGAGDVQPTSYWVGAWLGRDSFMATKRWRRPRFILASTAGGTVDVGVYADFDPRTTVRTFDLDLPEVTSGGDWGTLVWGGDLWGEPTREFAELVKGRAVGNFEAIQFRIDGPSVLSRWRLDSVAAPYIPKPVR